MNNDIKKQSSIMITCLCSIAIIMGLFLIVGGNAKDTYSSCHSDCNFKYSFDSPEYTSCMAACSDDSGGSSDDGGGGTGDNPGSETPTCPAYADVVRQAVSECGSGNYSTKKGSDGCWTYECNSSSGGETSCPSGKYEYGTAVDKAKAACGSLESNYYISTNDNKCYSYTCISGGGGETSCPSGKYEYGTAVDKAKAACGSLESNYYISTNDNKCYSYTCIEPKCKSGYHMSNGQCCPDGTELDTNTQQCVAGITVGDKGMYYCVVMANHTLNWGGPYTLITSAYIGKSQSECSGCADGYVMKNSVCEPCVCTGGGCQETCESLGYLSSCNATQCEEVPVDDLICYRAKADPTPIVHDPENPSYDPPSDDPSNPSNPSNPGNNNVNVNPETGSVAIFIVWIVALSTLVYSFWYFKKKI